MRRRASQGVMDRRSGIEARMKEKGGMVHVAGPGRDGDLRKGETRRFLSPWRCVFSILSPVFVAQRALRKGSVDRSGAIAGTVLGFVLALSNACFFAALLAFFYSGSRATRFRSHRKRQIEDGYKEGGQRNWVQVICTAGVATNVAVLYILETGCGEYAVDFSQSYMVSWLSMAVLGVLAYSAGDTWASEIGSVLGPGQPRLVTTLQPVPHGTNGGISLVGTLASVLGGAFVGVTYYLALLMCVSRDTLEAAPSQWPIIIVGALTGFIGSLIDSVIGAWFQYSGVNEKTGKVVEYPGDHVRDICGTPVLDNHGVNMVTTAAMAFASPHLAIAVWGYFR